MTFEQYWATLLKRWKLIVTCFVLLGLGTYIGNKFITPLYQSTSLVEVAISSSSTDINNLLASDQLVQTEASLATSDPVLREVASHYSGLTSSTLTKEVTATARLNTQLFEIDVLDPSPTRAAAIANDVAAVLIKQQQQMFQQETAQGGFLIVAQSAQPNASPVQPNTRLNLAAGLLVGLFLGMLLAYLFERFDSRIHTVEELTRLLNWTVMATIEQVKPEEILNPLGQNINAESFRILRTNIGFSVIDKPLHSLLITSAMPRDGKSVIAANLAIFMAKAGKNTLLIDADLHRPAQHTQFGLPSHLAGLSNAIIACNMLTTANSFSHQQFLASPLSLPRSNTPNLSLDPFMHATGIPNLRVMPSGSLPPNPSELLDSRAMQQLMLSIEKCGAEVVIFDAPPLLGLSDTTILMGRVDATLMVVDITRANKKSLKQTKAVITQIGTPLLGCVVNKQPRGHKNPVYSYYYHEEQQNSEMNQAAQNGHSMPVVPKTPLLSIQSDEQRMWPN